MVVVDLPLNRLDDQRGNVVRVAPQGLFDLGDGLGLGRNGLGEDLFRDKCLSDCQPKGFPCPQPAACPEGCFARNRLCW